MRLTWSTYQVPGQSELYSSCLKTPRNQPTKQTNNEKLGCGFSGGVDAARSHSPGFQTQQFLQTRCSRNIHQVIKKEGGGRGEGEREREKRKERGQEKKTVLSLGELSSAPCGLLPLVNPEKLSPWLSSSRLTLLHTADYTVL